MPLGRTCKNCGKEFTIPLHYLRENRGYFCCRECYITFQRKNGLPQEHKDKLSLAKLGKPGNRPRTKVERTCQYCGKIFEVNPHRIKKGVGIYCSSSCSSKANFPNIKQNLDFKRLKSYAQRGWGRTERMCEMCGGNFLSQLSRNRRFCSRSCASISTQKKLWSSPEYRERQIAAISLANATRPTEPEQKVSSICSKYFPQFRYNGDYSLGIVITGLVPDFINTNGGKEIIEVFGDYWHNRKEMPWHQTELGRTMAYNSVGYKTLILWEHDLKKKSEAEIVNTIKSFTRGGKKCRV